MMRGAELRFCWPRVIMPRQHHSPSLLKRDWVLAAHATAALRSLAVAVSRAAVPARGRGAAQRAHRSSCARNARAVAMAAQASAATASEQRWATPPSESVPKARAFSHVSSALAFADGFGLQVRAIMTRIYGDSGKPKPYSEYKARRCVDGSAVPASLSRARTFHSGALPVDGRARRVRLRGAGARDG
jgi:hypothetical protein